MSKMSQRKKDFNILEAVDEIVREKRLGRGMPNEYREYPRLSGRPRTSRLYLRGSSPIEYWREYLLRTRATSHFQVLEELSDIPVEVSLLRDQVRLLIDEQARLDKAINEVRRRLGGKITAEMTQQANLINGICKVYVDLVSPIQVVKQVLVIDDGGITSIWTVIDAPPYEDQLRMPIYEAQLQLLRLVGEEDIPLDFLVINVSELPDNQELASTVPQNAKIFWQR